MKEYPQREIFRKGGRYANCQVMTNWTSSQGVPKYIACNDLKTGDQFLAKQDLGTWMEEDVILVAKELNDNIVTSKGLKGAPVKLTVEQLHEVGQRLLALVPGGSEYFSKDGDGFKVDVFAIIEFLERNRFARLKLEKFKKKLAENPSEIALAAVEDMIAHGNRNGISDRNMAKAISSCVLKILLEESDEN